MRDRINQTKEQFNIQLSETVQRVIQRYDQFLTRPVFVSPTLRDDSTPLVEQTIRYPRNFRLLRTLSIIQWWFPEELHWRVLIDLQDKTFSWLNDGQKVVLSLLLKSKESCLFYLYWSNQFSGNELYGNILGNDLKDLFKEFKITKIKKLSPPRKAIRRRGYKDKGSRRPDHRWIPQYDFSLNEIQLRLEKERNQSRHLIQTFLNSFELNSVETFLELEQDILSDLDS